jgi:glycosyltransferase involved in cell wall biosynthesis
MRPLTIVHTEFSNGWGGQEMRIVQEAQGIAARGHRVIIAARPECQILVRAHAADLPTAELPMRNGFDLMAIIALCRLIRREHADIVNTHSSVDSWIGAFAATLTGAKLIRTRHLSKPVSRHGLNFVYRMPDVIMTTSAIARRQLIAHNRLPPARVLSVPTGIDTAHFAPQPCAAELKTRWGLPAHATIVSTVAALRSWKRHDVLLHAAARLRDWPDVYCVIAGDGSQRAGIEQLRDRLGLTERVVLLGYVDDVRPVFSCSDIVVLCSSEAEGVSQSLAQALAMARPAIATDVGGSSELITPEATGLLIPPNDPAALAAAIERFLRDPSLAAECGRRGREHIVAHFSQRQMIERILGLYERLTS